MKKEDPRDKKYMCKKCKYRCGYAPGIGHFCLKCGRDWGLEECKK